MPDLLTRRGARTLSKTLDGVAEVFHKKGDEAGNAKRAAILGMPGDLALEFAQTCDRFADHVETVAVANYPDSDNPHVAAVSPSVVDKTPAQDADPDVSGVTETSGGNTDEAPDSDDQNKPETYMGKGGRRQAAEWAQPAKNETGQSIEPGGSAPPHWDANAIGDDRGGPYLQDPDEAYMRGEFTQQEFHELRDKQQAGVLPGVDRSAAFNDQFKGFDTKLATLTDDPASLAHLGREFQGMTLTRVALQGLSGLDPMALRGHTDRIVQIRQEIAVVQRQFTEALKRVSGLEADEKKGVAALKKAADSMNEKGKHLLATENGLLQFAAFMSDKAPGIDQMIARGDEAKNGQLAADYFGRISARLGDQIAADVELCSSACQDDLTYARMVIRGLKVTAKTASVDNAALKQAGIADLVVSFREWLTGGRDALVQRLLAYPKDINAWVKSFTTRTKMVAGAAKDINSLISSAEKDINGAFAFAKMGSGDGFDFLTRH